MKAFTEYFLICTVTVLSLYFNFIICQDHVISKARAIRDYLTLCPKNGICNHKESLLSVQSCCGPCHCSQESGYDSCPDGPQHFMSKEEIVSLKRHDIWKCIKPSLKTDMLSNNLPFYQMIGRCPYGYSDLLVKDKCLQPLDVIFLGDNIWNIPITINSTGKTYKNIFCAICNNDSYETGMIWDTYLTCYWIPQKQLNVINIINMTSVQDIQTNIPDMCNVLFQHPSLPWLKSNHSDTKECSGVIDRCNVTGKWKGEPFPYNFYTETSCLSYRSEYKSFKNVHCYFCNGGNYSEIETTCFPSHVSALTQNYSLFIRNAIRSREQRCTFGFVHDSSTDACRQLHCSNGLVYDGVRCVPFLQFISKDDDYVVYEVTLTFEPDTRSLANKVTASFIHSAITSIQFGVINELKNIKSADIVNLCDSGSVIKFRQNPLNLINTLKTERRKLYFFDVMYFATSFRISIAKAKYFTHVIEDLQQLYNIKSIKISGNSLLSVSRIIDSTLLSRVLRRGPDKTADLDKLDTDKVESLELNTYLKYALVHSVKDNADGFAIAPLPDNLNVINEFGNTDQINGCDSVASVDADVFCPKIKLTSGDYDLKGTQLKVKNVNIPISRNSGYFGSSLTTFWICHEVYTKLLRDAKDAVTSGIINIKAEWVSVLIAFAFAFHYV